MTTRRYFTTHRLKTTAGILGKVAHSVAFIIPRFVGTLCFRFCFLVVVVLFSLLFVCVRAYFDYARTYIRMTYISVMQCKLNMCLNQ